jgi:hypothetical protein
MRLNELARKKKIVTPYDPVEAARESLEWYKEDGIKRCPNNTLQLFVPRKIERYATKKEREEHILRDRAKYAYDDNGDMIPQYRDWVNNVHESIIDEGAPVLAGGNPLIGGSKPLSALLWTSTAKKLDNGKWTSDWNNFIQGGNLGSSKPSKIGYLYKVLPNTLVYELDSAQDALIIYKIFKDLGRPNKALDDPNNWERTSEFYRNSNDTDISIIQKDFPWPDLSANFDCIHHWGGRNSFNYDSFTGGYDVESSCFFKPNQLELLGQVPLWTPEDDKEDDF